MARAKTTPKRQPLVIRSLTLTHDADETLQRLSKDASDYIGRAVSGSAVVRALLRHVAQQPVSWVTARIFPLVEKELNSGVMWGKKK